MQKVKAAVLRPPDAKNWFLEKDPDARKDWRQEKGMTEDEMVGRHHRLHGHESEQAPGVGEGQGGLACCSPWSRKQSDMTEWLNWTELNWGYHVTANDVLAFGHEQPRFKQTRLEVLQETVGWVERSARSNSSFLIFCAVWERGLSFLEMSLNPSKVAPEPEQEAGQEPGSKSQGPGLKLEPDLERESWPPAGRGLEPEPPSASGQDWNRAWLGGKSPLRLHHLRPASRSENQLAQRPRCHTNCLEAPLSRAFGQVDWKAGSHPWICCCPWC